MANFTIELKKIANRPTVREALNGYQLFDESHREKLNNKILAHYWYYEIGHETVDMFVFQLRIKMNEIMPYYNELYKSAAQEYGILDQFDVVNTIDQNGTQTGSTSVDNNVTANSEASQDSTNANTAKSRAVGYELPQTRLSGDENYGTNAQDSLSSGDTTSHSTGNNRETTTGTTLSKNDSTSKVQNESHSKGRQTSGAQLVMEYRQAILNIDMMIIDELSELFMGLWATNDDIFSD